MPKGPLLYGYSVGRGVCVDRPPTEHESVPVYLNEATAAANAVVAAEIEAAKEAFEAYRKAVEQGVAVEPVEVSDE